MLVRYQGSNYDVKYEVGRQYTCGGFTSTYELLDGTRQNILPSDKTLDTCLIILSSKSAVFDKTCVRGETERILPHGTKLDILMVEENCINVSVAAAYKDKIGRLVLVCDPDTTAEERQKFIEKYRNCRNFDEIKNIALNKPTDIANTASKGLLHTFFSTSNRGYFLLSQVAGLAVAATIVTPAALSLLEPITLTYSMMFAGGIIGVSTAIFNGTKDKRPILCCLLVFVVETGMFSGISYLAFECITADIITDVSVDKDVAQGVTILIVALAGLLLNSAIKAASDKLSANCGCAMTIQ